MAKAQGAMEYMLTYGWAILVVMVVGIVMWEIGVFNLGGSTTTTSSGFSQLKPMLATCKMSEDVGAGGLNGFECMFTNTLPTAIKVWETTNVTVDGKYCQNMLIGIGSSNSDYFIYNTCPTDEGPCSDLDCPPNPLCHSCGGRECLYRPAGSVFFIRFISQEGSGRACDVIEPGKKYEAFVEIVYDINIGGISVTKRDSGYIRGAME